MKIKVELLKNQWGYYRISINDRLISHDNCNGKCTLIYSFIVELDEKGNVVEIERNNYEKEN